MVPNKHLNVEYIALSDLDKPLPTPPSSIKQITSKLRRSTGWRFGIKIAAITTTCVLLINVILTIYATLRFGVTAGVGIAYEGDCETVTKYTTWLHIIINIIGSLLLAASNYSMQCLAAPTREECDRAHARGDWLDIGILSVRNIFKLHRGRIVLWFILALSSVPIHLLYNSTIYKTITANYYHALVVDEGFLRGQPLILAEYTRYSDDTTFRPQQYFDFQENWLTNGSSYQNLTTEECVAVYAIDYVQDYNDVLLVTHDTDNNTVGHVWSYVLGPMENVLEPWSHMVYYPYQWMCTPDDYTKCTQAALHNNASDFSLSGHKIAYCLAQRPPAHCQLQFSTTMLIVVIVCNFVKAMAMLTVLCYQASPTLVVVGDAVASFLDRPDEYTKQTLTISQRDIRSKRNSIWSPLQRVQRWMNAASATQWTFFSLLCISCLLTTSILLWIAAGSAAKQGESSSTAFNIGFGAISPTAIISSLFRYDNVQATTSAILLGNLPQVVMSFAYLLLNGLLSSMLLCHEWSAFALRRQSLRVTTPVGQQRSTYWLHLPWTYSVPLISLSVLMHWLISEAFFLIRLQTRKFQYVSDVSINSTAGIWPAPQTNFTFAPSGDADIGDVVIFYPNHTHAGSTLHDDIYSTTSALGYSPVPILCTLLVAIVLFFGILGLGCFRRFQSNMPVASSCSLAIASACHPPSYDYCSTKAIQWGMVTDTSTETTAFTFTSLAVQAKQQMQKRSLWSKLRSRTTTKASYDSTLQSEHEVLTGLPHEDDLPQP